MTFMRFIKSLQTIHWLCIISAIYICLATIPILTDGDTSKLIVSQMLYVLMLSTYLVVKLTSNLNKRNTVKKVHYWLAQLLLLIILMFISSFTYDYFFAVIDTSYTLLLLGAIGVTWIYIILAEFWEKFSGTP